MLRSPFPYFGGKSRIADEVWRRFGKCTTYIEPFFGSGAVLLANPYWQETVETVNDINHYICNFWRAVKAAPDAVAKYADYPAIETDLHVRHLWLVNEGAEIVKRCAWDEDFYDAKVAGWWVWGMALWIGGGFCDGNGGWTRETLRAAEELGTYDLNEIRQQRPDLAWGNQKGVSRRRLQLSSAGHGIQRKSCNLYDYIAALSERLRRVRVCCGDWKRVLTPAVTWVGENSTKQGICGIFLDPPYSKDANRDMRIYGKHDDGAVAHNVREWCKANGNNRQMRIALCGYDGEHNELESLGWSVYAWKANGGYAHLSSREKSRINCWRERVWFSPYCIDTVEHWIIGENCEQR